MSGLSIIMVSFCSEKLAFGDLAGRVGEIGLLGQEGWDRREKVSMEVPTVVGT